LFIIERELYSARIINNDKNFLNNVSRADKICDITYMAMIRIINNKLLAEDAFNGVEW
jgi:hypothetical protein